LEVLLKPQTTGLPVLETSEYCSDSSIQVYQLVKMLLKQTKGASNKKPHHEKGKSNYGIHPHLGTSSKTKI
jgi:hypothetical protein